jgi:hypothetical protein
MVNAGRSSDPRRGRSNAGRWSTGTPASMSPNRDRIVSTGRSKNATTAVLATIATNAPGTRGENRGVNRTMRIAPSPMARANRLVDSTALKYSIHFGTNSVGRLSTDRPRRSLTCVEKMRTAIPDVKPVMSVWGTYSISEPRRRTPITIRKNPAMIVESIRPSRP